MPMLLPHTPCHSRRVVRCGGGVVWAAAAAPLARGPARRPHRGALARAQPSPALGTLRQTLRQTLTTLLLRLHADLCRPAGILSRRHFALAGRQLLGRRLLSAQPYVAGPASMGGACMAILHPPPAAHMCPTPCRLRPVCFPLQPSRSGCCTPACCAGWRPGGRARCSRTRRPTGWWWSWAQTAGSCGPCTTPPAPPATPSPGRWRWEAHCIWAAWATATCVH